MREAATACTTFAGMSGDDWEKWLALAGILISLGVLPAKLKGPVTGA